MKYQIRPLEEKDIGEIVRGEEAIFGTSLGFDLIYSDLKLNPFAHYLVLEVDKHIGGYIGLWIHDDTAEVINFYIDLPYQRQGFGTMLLDFAVSLCEMSGVKSISLEVRENNVAAIALYEKFGFVFSHKRLKYYQDLSDALVLIKRIEE
ncbi:MAG: ribosomal protein S18-alanine N-acetyltransferase [Bacilli bacterium]|nr:ribosomal protein S18-alanine N-acetyltransferase [Bacilli bacterium]